MIPVPSFLSGDETSMKLSCPNLTLSTGDKLSIQFKVPQAPWDKANEISVDSPVGGSVSVSSSSQMCGNLVDLEPGTPYSIRFVVTSLSGEKKYGPETVFDTKPIGCAPKKDKKTKTCSIQ
jgi:hypothetical protein